MDDGDCVSWVLFRSWCDNLEGRWKRGEKREISQTDKNRYEQKKFAVRHTYAKGDSLQGFHLYIVNSSFFLRSFDSHRFERTCARVTDLRLTLNMLDLFQVIQRYCIQHY